MPLESCMLVLDNSEYMRNGDYVPTRFQAQAQAVSTVFTAKTDSNPESAVGLMTMAGKSPSLLVTPTNDIGKLLSALSKSTIGGTSDLATAVQIAQLALKHRENKNQKQRIVVFVGSPLEDSQDSLVKLGKKLRKNNVLVDVVTFGEEGMGNDEKLNALIEAVGGESADSHLVSVPPGPLLLADAIISSPILFQGGTGGEGGAEGMGGFAGADGIDPNMDPELAMAIRMSLAEAEQAAGRSAAPQAGPSSSTTAQPAGEASTTNAAALPSTLTQPLTNAMDSDVPMASGDVPPNPQSAAVATGGVGAEQDLLGDDEDEDEDEMLRRAMALSRGENPSEDVTMADVEGDDDEEDEETAIARAIAMSLEEDKKGEDKESK